MAVSLLKPSFSNKVNSPSNSNFQGQNAKISYCFGGQHSIANFYPTETTPEIGTLEGVQDCIDSFKGRGDVLDELSKRIAQLISKGNKGTTVRSLIQVLSGVGGVGKTETVRKYILDNKKNFRRVIWIKAAKYKDARNCFIQIAEDANIPIKDRKGKLRSDEDIVKQIFTVACQRVHEPRKISDNFPSLFVFDNVEEIGNPPKKIANLLPQAIPDQWVPPVFIVTTRQSKWEKLPDSQYIELTGLDKEDSWALLSGSLKLEKTRKNCALVEEVRTLYDGLPLVMQQVIAFVNENSNNVNYTLKNFLNDVKKQEPRFLKTTPEDCHVKTSVFSLYELTFKKLSSQKHGKEALKCPDVMVLLNPDGIPWHLLQTLMQNVDLQELESAIQLLLNYKLITIIGTSSVYEIHRVVQLVRRRSESFTLPNEPFSGKKLFSLYRYLCLNKVVTNFRDYVDAFNKDLSSEEINNGLILLENVKDAVGARTAFNCIDVIHDKLKQTGFCPHIAVKFLEIALEIAEREKDFDSTRGRKVKLATGYFRSNDFNQALQLYTEVIATQVFWQPCHPDVLISKECLASLHKVLGNFQESERLYEDVLGIRRRQQLYNLKHDKDILATKTNLILVYVQLRNIEKARKLYEEVIPEIENQLESTSEATLKSILKVAIDLEHQSVYDEAKELLQRMRRDSQKNVLFPRDNRIFSLRTMYALVVAYGNPRKPVQAKKIIHHLVSHWEHQPIPMYSCRAVHTIPKWIQLAEVFKKFGMFDKAQYIYLQLKSWDGLQNDVLTFINSARVYNLQRKYEDAKISLSAALSCYRVQLRINEEELGPTSNDKALMYEYKGDHDRAGRIYRYHLLRRQNAVTKPTDITSQVAQLQTKANLARVFMIEHNYAHAEVLYEEILPELEACLRGQPERMIETELKSFIDEQRQTLYEGPLWFYREFERKRLDSGAVNAKGKDSTSKSLGHDDPKKGEEIGQGIVFKHMIIYRLRLEATQFMAKVYQYKKNYAVAQKLYNEVILKFEEIFGENHSETLNVVTHLAGMYCNQGIYEKAQHCCERVLSAISNVEDGLHLKLILAVVYFFNGKPDQAENLFNEVISHKKQEIKELYVQLTFKMFVEIYYKYFSNDGNGDRTTSILRDHQTLYFLYKKEVAGQHKSEEQYFSIKTVMAFIKIIESENGVADASEMESDLESEFEWEIE